MIYYLKYNVPAICERLLNDQLENSGIPFKIMNTNEIDINESTPNEALETLNIKMSKLGIEMVSSKKTILVEQIKAAIIKLLNLEDQVVLSNTSQYLARTLNQHYRNLSAVFSELTYTTIESFVILQKIEKAKSMITAGELSFSEIAWQLNYSSVAHFSMQFKNTTGLTPTLFKKIILQKRTEKILH